MDLGLRRALSTSSNDGCQRRRIIGASSLAATPVAMLAVVILALPARSEQSVSQRELQAKIDYCQTCHGASARGFRGYTPIPRLAGQQPEYLKNQLNAFVAR